MCCRRVSFSSGKKPMAKGLCLMYLEQKVIGDGELTIQLAIHRVDFLLQFSCVTNDFVDVSFLLLNIANDFQYA